MPLYPKPLLRVVYPYEKPGLLCKCVPKQGLGNERNERTRNILKSVTLCSFPSPGLGMPLYPKPLLRVVYPYEKPGLLCKCVPKQGLGNERNILKSVTLYEQYIAFI